MKLLFTKIHGCGNDYLFVDCLSSPLERAGEVARIVSQRRSGVGSDGLICIYPSNNADVRMEMYNADGSRGEMCGNGIRGLGKYLADRGLVEGDCITVETDAGIKKLDLYRENGHVSRVRVDMGQPILEGRSIPVDADGEVVDHPLEVAGRLWQVTCVSMGNPHCVTFDANPDGLDLEAIGPAFQSHPFFPHGTNTEFARVDNRRRLTMRVWERGSGETLACGTGACAVVVAAVHTGRTEGQVTVGLRGGELEIEYREGDTVFQTGPAVKVFSGSTEINLPEGSGQRGEV